LSGPLAGLRVVEMAGLGPCPLAGQLLADLGADVIVIDRKSGKADRSDVNRRSKRSVALDLKREGAVAAALDVIARADVLIEGFRPGVMEKLGLGPEPCLARNPRLVYGRMTGWGQEGPLADRAGHDINYLSITGALGAIGRSGEPPVPPLNLAADYAGGTMFLLLGVLSALFERNSSGRGQVVDAAMIDGVPALMGIFHTMLARGMWNAEREANLLDGGAPFYRCYETADGKYMSVGALEPQFFAEFARIAGIPPDHCASQYDPSQWPARREQYAAIFRSRTRAQWEAAFAGSDACVAPVLGWDETAAHPQNAARGIFRNVDGVMQAAPAPRFDRTPAPPAGKPAAPGGDSDEILAEAGFSAGEIGVLRATGALT
jgi:alpha-methylacyl-CoA racemase